MFLVMVVWFGKNFNGFDRVYLDFGRFLKVDVGIEGVNSCWWCDIIGFDVVGYFNVV